MRCLPCWREKRGRRRSVSSATNDLRGPSLASDYTVKFIPDERTSVPMLLAEGDLRRRVHANGSPCRHLLASPGGFIRLLGQVPGTEGLG